MPCDFDPWNSSTDIQLWEDSASAWVSHLGKHGDQSRRFMDPRVWQVLGDVANRQVLDIGCGEGRFSRQLAERGAETTGVEPSKSLHEKATELGGKATYINCRAEALPFSDNTFDVVLFYLVLIDIEPFIPAVAEAFRVLKPGGQCVIVNLTSMNTASERFWEFDSQGNKIGWLMDSYADSRRIVSEWNGIKVHNYHRPLSQYLQAFLTAGFQLYSFNEAFPTDAEVVENPDLEAQRICPYFNLQVWQK